MKDQNKKFKNSKEFGKFLGLSELEIELIDQKKKIIEKLKKARLNQNLSQSQLAQILETKQPAIARMESGLVSEISLDFIAKAAFALGISFTLKATKAA
jgi:ribosome-binding protein aMBF1 (putative translation factor)